MGGGPCAGGRKNMQRELAYVCIVYVFDLHIYTNHDTVTISMSTLAIGPKKGKHVGSFFRNSALTGIGCWPCNCHHFQVAKGLETVGDIPTRWVEG